VVGARRRRPAIREQLIAGLLEAASLRVEHGPLERERRVGRLMRRAWAAAPRWRRSTWSSASTRPNTQQLPEEDPSVEALLDMTGIPTPASTRPALIERRLKEAYATLTSRNLIRPDRDAGSKFCEITPSGRQRLDNTTGADLRRVGFAAAALTIDLYPALQSRSIDVNFRQGQFETALRDSSAFMEGSIRQLAGLPAATVGSSWPSRRSPLPRRER
jgi:hypothetical protein